MTSKELTFREGLKASISDFLSDVNMTCPETEEALVALVVALADHREEGTQLFPRVVICDGRAAVLRILQGTSAIKIGDGPKVAATVMRALKKCAPLADRGWGIWIDRADDLFTYGVFREAANPTSLDLRRTLFDMEPDDAFHALMVAQFAPGKVELVSVNKSILRVHLSGERADQLTMGAEGEIVRRWASAIEDEFQQEAFVSFGATLLHDLLRRGHGALIAVAPHDAGVGDYVADAVILDSPIELAALVRGHGEDGSSEALSELLDNSQLLAGMLGSDGVVLLDSVGRILAFNWFVETDTSKLTPSAKLGGARHRAFEALKNLVDDGKLCGAFIRSSDGGEKVHVGSNDA